MGIFVTANLDPWTLESIKDCRECSFTTGRKGVWLCQYHQGYEDGVDARGQSADREAQKVIAHLRRQLDECIAREQGSPFYD